MAGDSSNSLNEYQQYELQKVASKGKNITTLVALVFPPAGYYMVGKTGIAALCFFTAHFGTLAHLVAPFHTRRIIKSARKQVGGSYSDGSILFVLVGLLLMVLLLLAVGFVAVGILGLGL